jgi:hypothetical protein
VRFSWPVARPLLALPAVKCVQRCAIVSVLVLAPCRPGFAQSEGRFAVGGEFAVRLPADRTSIDGSKGPGLLWRFGHGKTGWGWHWGLNWFSADVDGPAGIDTEIGELHVRPVMAGYGYTRVVGHNTVTAAVIAGYAVTSMSLTPAAVNAYRDRLGAQSATVDVSNTLTARPEVSVWHDVNKKIGINVSAGYIVARPNVTVRSSLGEEARRVRADMFTVKVGAVYSIR